jgi:4-hydroxybenzoate polyprenyltransferase
MKRDGLHPILAEIIFGGHLASLGLSSIGLTLFLLEDKPVRLVPLVATYLISQTIYSYNRYRELRYDLESNPERSEHLQATIAWTQISPWCYSLLLLLCLSLTNIRLFLLGMLLVAGGILYTDFLKEPATKRIPGFKNLYTSLFLALSVFIVPLYLSGKISPVYLYFSLFLFFRMGINTVFCDIKDIQSDAERNLKTLPVLLGKAPSLVLLEVANLVSLAALLGAVHAGILPWLSLALTVSVAYDLVYLSLAFRWDGQKLRSLTYVMADLEFWIWPLAVLALRVVR